MEKDFAGQEDVIPDGTQSFWLTFITKYLLYQAILGLIIFELCWYATRNHRQVNEKRDGKFPEFRCGDDISKWSRAMFYPGALLCMPTRAALFILSVMLCALIAGLLAMGHDFSKGPITGWRKYLILKNVHYTAKFQLFVSGMKVKVKHVEADYADYLGPGYLEDIKKIKKASTIASTHTSWLDGFIMVYLFQPALLPAADVIGEAPVFSTIFKSLDSIIAYRGKDLKRRQKVADAVQTRQKLIDQGAPYQSICIFPEGTCTNGKYLLPFKRGCFEAEASIQPIYLQFKYSDFNTDYTVINMFVISFLTMCWIKCDLETIVNIMPIFKPNEHMFSKYKDKGTERWQVYAWALRDVMSKAAGLPLSDLPQRAKLAYSFYLKGTLKIKDFDNLSVDQIISEYNKKMM